MFTCCRSTPNRRPSGRKRTVSTSGSRTPDIETLYDDREEAPGVKFKDADLLGLPLRLTLSAKTLKENAVEVKIRRSGQIHMVKLDQIVSWIENWMAGQK